MDLLVLFSYYNQSCNLSFHNSLVFMVAKVYLSYDCITFWFLDFPQIAHKSDS